MYCPRAGSDLLPATQGVDMASLPVEVLMGIYLGLLVGVIPALVSWALGFSFKYFTGITVPGFGVVVLAIALAGVSGGLMALADKSITQAPNAERVITAIILVGMVSLYAHSKGDQLGATFPKRLSLQGLREKKLSADVVEFVGGRDEVRIRIVGDVADMEGYPPLSEPLRADIRNEEWRFPADLRIGELERRMEERLKSEFDLGDAAVSIDEQGRATVVAAPPFSGLSKRVGDNRHAVSVEALLPTGLARNDEVTVLTEDAQVRGTVVSARSDPVADETPAETPTEPEIADTEPPPTPVRAPTTDGGEGRLTVAVTRTDVQPLLRSARPKVVVEPRGTHREYELVSLLRRAGNRFRRLTVRTDGPLDGTTLRDARVREAYDVAVVAIRTPDGWQVAPRGEAAVEAGDELYAIGRRTDLDAFAEAVA
ncbi:potassium transporter TrkA [Haloarcula taiwanensis]|uniref:Potassium transporter TrkA n=1 Tax=Haloarcula taiwanensis TaxID=1932004 RepID=A0A2H4ZVS6_9EURY|nr:MULTISPECIES: TrkA C-terminal domain-containing protein [Haloarcula]AUG46586.1 potassium transporter TrkA [Haloarcula taiwanensis]RLM44823.1 potassium transporter TrkA [Haloarcula sp. Atlit-47R]